MTAPPATGPFWRVFPWDARAKPGEPFSAAYVPAVQGSGRFDLAGRPPVLYLAESPAHAVGEKIQRYRSQEVGSAELREYGHPLALVDVSLSPSAGARIADLNDPAELVRYGCHPDELMSRDVARSRSCARRLHDRGGGLAAFRIWSALTGDWHPTIVFLDRVRVRRDLRFGAPVLITVESAAVRDAAAMLAIRLADR